MNWESQWAKRELLHSLQQTVCGITECNVIDMTICSHTVGGMIRIGIKHVFGRIDDCTG